MKLFIFITSICCFLSVKVSAYPPAPHHILEGLVRNEQGVPIIGDNIKVIAVSTEGSSIVSKVNVVFRPGVNYILHVPMESGVGRNLFDTAAFKHKMEFSLKVIIDGKDYLPIEMIGNTSKMYASAFLKDLDFDSITVSPYMGSDSVEPFLTFDDKYVFLLALTSNKGSEDFQELFLNDNSGKLYEKVINISKTWTNNDRIMYVIGAKNTEEIKNVRKLVPESYLLIPGVGAQGGNLKEICKYGLDKNYKLIVNSSRSIIYASSDDDFADKAALEAKTIQNEMQSYINKL